MKRWPLHEAWFWETAPFFRALLPFALGIYCYDWGAPHFILPFGVCIALMAAAFFIYTGLVYLAKDSRARQWIVFGALQVFFFFGGIAMAYAADARNDAGWFGNAINPENTCRLRLLEAPAERESSWRIRAAVISAIDSNGNIAAVTGEALLYLRKEDSPPQLQKGDTVLAPGKWQLITNSGNPSEFDYAAWCRRNNLIYRQFCTMASVHLCGHASPADLPVTARGHDWCMAQLDKYIPDPKARGLIQAMVIGDEINLDRGLLQSYADTGIVHIIAISGGNVAIFFAFISWLFFWLKDKRHIWVRYAVALPLVWFYVVMAGGPPSAVRAALMFSLVAGAVMLQRQHSSLNALLAAAFLLLCIQPAWLFAAGFQLSFLAVLSLVLFYGPVYGLLPKSRLLRGLWSTVAASIAAELLVAPLIVYYFHMFPLLFVVANVFAYLFMSFVLLLGIAIIIMAALLPFAAGLIGAATAWVVTFFDGLVTIMQKANPESFHFLQTSGFELLLLYAVICCISFFLIRRSKAALFAGLGAACCLWAAFCGSEWLRQTQERFVVYNLGHLSHMEVIKGAGYEPLPPPAGSLQAVLEDSTTRQKIDYAARPAHIRWRAWQKGPGQASDVYTIAGKTILVLDEAPYYEGHFPASYVVINYVGAIDIKRMKELFAPTEIVIGNACSPRQQQKLVNAGAAIGVKVHAVALAGAFVAE